MLSHNNPLIGKAFLLFTLSLLGAVGGSFAFLNPVHSAPDHRGASDSESPPSKSINTQVVQQYGNLPLSFERNEGQVDQQVKFLSHGPGYELFLTAGGAVLTLQEPPAAKTEKDKLNPNAKVGVDEAAPSVLRLRMIGTNRKGWIEGQNELAGKTNYLIGNDREKWRTNIPTYARVRYENLYPGVSLVYYGNHRQLEYDFVVAAGANPRVIKFEVSGANKIERVGEGNLILSVAGTTAMLRRPVVYQLADGGGRHEIEGRYVVKGTRVSFKVKKFDARRPLVIDPVLSYSTFFGPSADALAIAVDASGNAYITGRATSGIFPTTPGSLKPNSSNDIPDAFVTKLNSTGTALVYSTFLGGNGQDVGNSIALDSSGNAYVTGNTNSSNFPTVNAIRSSTSNFLQSVDSGGHWNGQFIGPANGVVNVLVVDPLAPNTIYAGTSLNGGTGIYKTTDGGNNWIALNTGLTNVNCSALAIDPTTPSTLYASLIPNSSFQGTLYKSVDGGNTWTTLTNGLSGVTVSALAVDPSSPSTVYAGSTFVSVYKSTNGGASWTNSSNGINFGGTTAVAVDPATPATVYASAGGGGVFKTTNGGANWGQVNTGLTNTTIRTLMIDAASNVYAGSAGGGLFKSTNGGGNWSPLNNGLPTFTFVSAVALKPSSPATIYMGTNGGLIYKTVDGGNNWTTAYETLTRTSFNALAINSGSSSTVYAGANLSGGALNDSEAFVSKLNADGSALVYSTYLGGSGDDFGNAIAVDANNGACAVAGQTSSTSFPTASPFQPSLNGTVDAFIAKFNVGGNALVYSTYLGGAGFDTASGIALDANGSAYVTGNTSSANFPLMNPFQSTRGDSFNSDAFAAKLGATGSLAYSTLLGGNGTDNGFGIAVDSSGSAYIAGMTTSTNFPLASALQSQNGGGVGDAFVTKLAPSGSSLVYSTYLGGQDVDIGRAITLDSSGNAYVTGSTSSADFPLVSGSLKTKSPLSRTSDAASNWSNDNYGIRSNVVTTLAIDPQNPTNVYAGSFNGPFKSSDSGRNWTPINSSLLDATISAIVVDPKNSSTLYLGVPVSNVGPTSGVYKSVNGGNTWSLVNNGLTAAGVAALVIDPVTPATLYAGSANGIFKTTNGGSSWSRSDSGLVFPTITALAVDPSNPTTVYAGGGFYKSTDGGASWSVSQTGLSGHISHIRIVPANTSIIYATGDSGAFKSIDAGADWSKLSISLGDIAVDPGPSSTVYAVGSTGTGASSVLKSTDGANTFTPASKGLTVSFVGSLLINPLDASQLYAGGSSSRDPDAFVTKINPAGTNLIYSTLLGGFPDPNDSSNTGDQGFGIAVDSSGHAYVTGITRSTDFPITPGAFLTFPVGTSFISKLIPSYLISGVVTQENAAPLSGVAVTLSGPQLVSLITAGDGFYAFSHLKEGDSFTLSVAKPGFTFTPPSQTFNNLTADQTVNFVAHPTNAPFFTVSGRVTSNSGGLSGVTMALSGSQPGLATTDGNGNYSFTLPGGGNYTITPSILGHSMSPPSQSFNNLSANQNADFSATRQNLLVTNINDTGAGSLRQAIIDANAIPGADTIVFNIPGAVVHTITPGFTLSEITDPVTIDGTSQPDYAGTPLIELNGNAAGSSANGLTISASNCTVRGLVINRFHGFGIVLQNNAGNTIQGNYVGLDPTGTLARPNLSGVALNNSSNNTIGGLTAAARNVLSGNSFAGLGIGGASNLIQGNFIGTNVTGTVALGNGTEGLRLSNISSQPSNNLIGGTTAGARNIISGNGNNNLIIQSSGNVIQGNFIGTDVTGSVKLSNNANGIDLEGANNLVGGTTAEARNIISGNSASGIFWNGFVSNATRIQGNFIGTDVTGKKKVGNSIGVSANGPGILIGGPGAGNLISGNDGPGIQLNSSSGIVQGNLIGTDLTGNVALGNMFGVLVESSNNQIGGPVAEQRNVISGNQFGVQIGGQVFPGPSGNVVQGNYIGLGADGNQPLPNVQGGVAVSDSSNNTIGGTDPRAGNKIVNNGGTGVLVSAGTGNLIRANSIFANTGLGIDLLSGGHTGVTNNDSCDSDSGPNNLQNYPLLSSAVSTSSSTTVQGTLNSTPNTTFTIEFFTNTTCDSSGFGEAQQSLGTTTVTTDAACIVGFIVNLPFAVGGQFITATATDPNGNTSEMSNCFQATGAPGPTAQFDSSNYSVNEGSTGATITVTRTGDTSSAVTVDYATSDDTAHQSGDYSVASGTLTFAAGETSKTFPVLINKDAYVEGNEKLNVALSNPTGGATLGSTDTATLTIVDDTSVPPNTQPLDEARDFVSQHYYDFLSRVPDQGGLDYWSGQISQCGSD